MGSCMSKCIPSKEKAIEKEQDKGVVVSQVLVMHEVLPPRSPPSSSNSLASFSSTTEKSISSSASSLSSASSFPVLKDKSFSNEFLLSCAKENPQIISSHEENSLKKTNVQVYSRSSLAKVERQMAKVTSVSVHSQSKPVCSTPLKRICPSTPNQTRPKRANPMRPPSPMRTPSPCRRFVNNGNSYDSLYCQRKAKHSGTSFCFEKEKESNRKLSPINRSKTKNASSTCKQTCSHRVGSKIEEVEVTKAMAKQDLDVEMEGIDNAVITLDCFIFL